MNNVNTSKDKVAAGSGRRDETRPALKAAAADPAGTFTAAAAEAGEEDDDEEFTPALKAAAAALQAHLQRPLPRRAEMMEKKKKNHRLRSRRQPQTRGAPLQRSPPRPAAQHQAAGRGYPQRCC